MKKKTKRQLLAMYDWVGGFCEGLAPARGKKGEFHVCRDGTPAYPQRFAYVSFFDNGLAEVRGKRGRWFYINHDGKKRRKRRKRILTV